MRVIKEGSHALFLEKNGAFFSSSANTHKAKFDEKWAKQQADIIIDKIFFESKASNLIKLSRSKLKKIR